MKTYEVSFILNGIVYRECVTTTDGIKARELVKSRYAGAKILGASEVK